MVRWSWVSGVVFGLAACGGRYDVGSGEGGAAGAGNEGAVGGSETSGSGGSVSSGVGGAGTNGSGGSAIGSGGSATGSGGSATGSGGSAIGSGGNGLGGGASPVGGSAGSGGAVACVQPLGPEDGFAEPAEMWRRLSLFLYGEEREPLEALPEETSFEWISEQVQAIVRGSREAGDEPPAGLVRFVRGWALSNLEGTDDRARLWTDETMLSTVAAFFEDPDDPSNENHSLLLELSFLRNDPTISSRGAFIANQFLCVGVARVENEPALMPPEPGETSRQVLMRMTSAPTCAGCHGAIDPLGSGLSHYDAAGEYRETENGLPIDASGSFEFGSASSEFDGATELSQRLAASPELRECLAEQLLFYAVREARGVELSNKHLPIETGFIVCESAQEGDSFLRMIEAVAMVPSMSMSGW